MYEDDKMEQGGVKTNESTYQNSQNNPQSDSVNTTSPNYSQTYSQNYGNYGSGQGQANNTYSYNPYSYGNNQQSQNTYRYGNAGSTYSYNQQQTGTYGTYQYATGNNANMNTVKPAKKNTAAIVVAAIAILALLVGGIGASYYTIANRVANKTTETTQAVEEQQQAQIEQTETAKEKVETTTVSAETKAVVTDVTAVVEEVMPAMVIIHNNYTASASYFGYVQTQEATASGSGIIVGQNDTELLIATNYHVIEGADSLEVIFNDDTTLEAVVKGTNSDMDLAVIAVMLDDISSSTMDSIKVATLGDSDALVLGEPAIAIGNALGYGQSVTTGVISALNRQVELDDGSTREFIQTDAAINPGNSGGALLNLQGEVIGINSNKIGGDTVEGMGYAIPISAAKPIIEQLMNEETKIKLSDDERGYIGISGVSVTSEVSSVYGLPMGVYIAEVSNGGGAAVAGLEKGDVIVEFDGQEITSMDDLQTRLQYYAIGTTVPVTVMRQTGSEYTEVTYNVTLGAATTLNTQDSNAGENGGSSGQYDGKQSPGKPEDRSGNFGSGSGGH